MGVYFKNLIMTLKSILNEQIKNYLLENPIDRSKHNPYAEAAEKFGVDKELIRGIWRRLRYSGKVEVTNTPIIKTEILSSADYKITQTSDTTNVEKTSYTQVKNEKELAQECEIDLNEWKIEEWSCKRYNAWIKNTSGEIEQSPLYSIFAKLKRRRLDSDLEKQANLIKELKEHFSKNSPSFEIKDYVATGLLLELSAPDLHVGKLSWAEESGEDYDIKIACSRYLDALANLISRVPVESIGKILLPIGNDMITIDSRKNQTTAGTPQDSDSRFRKMLLVVKDLLINVIDTLSTIAPVDVVIVSGNHDYDSMFTIGMVLEAYYSTNPNIYIDNTPTQRKYYQFYNTGIMFTHGNEEKHNDLGLIFATEKPALWAATKFREVQLGHFHKNKKTNYVSVDEFQGFQIQVLPSLSGTDAWHNTKGYNSLKQAKAFLYDKDEGKIGEFTHTVKS